MKHGPLSALKEALKTQDGCAHHPPVRQSQSPEEAALFHECFQKCNATAKREHERWMAQNDLFYLCVYVLHRVHFIGGNSRQKGMPVEQKARTAKWCYDRCAEVQAEPNGCLDVWAREHWKSEIITFGKVIQDILRDPNETIGIFSHNRSMAKQFLRLIKTEFEANDELKQLFPEIFYGNPQRDSPKWSEDDGIVVKRDSNMKESTVEAWGLVDGQPTSKRFSIMVYDDIISRKEITEMMIAKSKEELENSFSLTASDPPVYRLVGTPQELGDLICQYMESGLFRVRARPAVDQHGTPLLLSEEKLASFKNRTAPKIFALQYLVDPSKARDAHNIGFEAEWFLTYRTPRNVRGLNRYILVDPAGKSKESNSLFAGWVIGLGPDRKVSILDGACDEFSLVQRADWLFDMVRKYEPLKVVYEKYAMQADIEHFHDRMDRENYQFVIVPVGGVSRSKDARIERMMPRFREGGVLFPETLPYRNLKGEQIDLTKRFRETEYSKFPFNPKCRDQLDALSRIEDNDEVNYVWPRSYGSSDAEGGAWGNSFSDGGGSWLSG